MFKGVCILLIVYFHVLLEKVYIDIIKYCLPIDKSLVIFRSKPDYSDNARALAEYMVENGYTKKYKVYYDVENKNKFLNKNSEITFFSSRAKYGRFKLSSIYRLFTAGYLMSTHEMIIIKKESRDGQLLVRLWHGCSFKDRASNDGIVQRSFDFALVSGPLFVDIKAYFWNVDKEYIHPLGFPRYDWLLKESDRAQNLKNTLCKNKESLVIWMPTFRNEVKGRYGSIEGLSPFPLMPDDNSWKELDAQCKKINVRIVIKTHVLQKEYKIPWNSFSNIMRITEDELSAQGIKLYEFLAVTDALVSDYSSVAIDYLIVNKPIAFALDDYKLYKDKRGFVFRNPLDYMPGHHLYNLYDMYDFLRDVVNKNDIYIDKRVELRNKAVQLSSHYCKDIADAIGLVL